MRRLGFTATLLAYASYFGYLVISGSMRELVHPRLTPLVVFGGCALLALAVAEGTLLIRDRKQGVSRASHNLPRGAGLMMIPILLIPLASGRAGVLPGEPVTQYVALAPVISPPEISNVQSQAVALPGTQPRAFRLTADNYYSTYNMLYSSPAEFRGDTIELTGRLMRTAGGAVLAAHELMWCCAADAVPLGFLCKGIQNRDMTDAGAWVRISGTLGTIRWTDPESRTESVVPLVTVTAVESLKGADFVFVYP